MAPVQFQRRMILAVIMVAFLAVLAGVWWSCARRDSTAFLPGHSGADWIVDARLPDGKAQPVAPVRTIFKRSFVLDTLHGDSIITVRAFRSASVTLNGRPIDGLDLDGKGWKHGATASVGGMLVAGTNEIVVCVTNVSGPPALWLRLETWNLALGSDETWLASPVESRWLNAQRAAETPELPPWAERDESMRRADSLRNALPAVALFTVVALALLLATPCCLRRIKALTPQKAIYGLFALVVVFRAVLFIHDAPLLPGHMGFDAKEHEDYVRFIQEKKTLPLPNDGWEMHQPPLYYLGSAVVLDTLGILAGTDKAGLPLRAINAIIGLVHCWLVLLCLRRLFPESLSAQAVGLLVAAFLPANLYTSMYVTNEPLTGLLVTLAFYFFLRLVGSGNDNLKMAAGLGLALGLAMLAKLSALVAVPVFLGAMGLQWLRRESPSPIRGLRSAGVVLLVFVLTCGWHYVRVWRQVGSLPMPNSQTDQADAWWQEPGFRTAGYYLDFGRSLVSPLFSARHSFWDGMNSTLWADGQLSGIAILVARPPWNYALQYVSILLGAGLILLAVFGLVIFLRRFARNLDPLAGLVSGMVIAYVAALIWLTISGPWLSTVKAFYAIPALLPFSVLIAAGWLWLAQRNRLVQTLLWLLVLVWSAAAFGSFWVRRDDVQLWRVRAMTQMADRNPIGVMEDTSRALHLAPADAYSRFLQAGALKSLGRNAEAIREFEESLRLEPDFPGLLNGLALVLCDGSKEDRARAVELATRACELTQYRQPGNAWILHWAHTCTGLTNEAAASFEFARNLAINTGQTSQFDKYAMLLNDLAWTLAVSPDAAWRDGGQAVQIALRACELTHYQKVRPLGTLAAAYAEVGRFDDAIATAQRACDLATQNKEYELLRINQGLLELYRAHKPAYGSAAASTPAVTP